MIFFPSASLRQTCSFVSILLFFFFFFLKNGALEVGSRFGRGIPVKNVSMYVHVHPSCVHLWDGHRVTLSFTQRVCNWAVCVDKLSRGILPKRYGSGATRVTSSNPKAAVFFRPPSAAAYLSTEHKH